MLSSGSPVHPVEPLLWSDLWSKESGMKSGNIYMPLMIQLCAGLVLKDVVLVSR